VRWIFARFLEIGSCTELAREVGARSIRTPRGNRIDKKYVYRMLSNRAYIGEAVHKGGEHDAIIDRETSELRIVDDERWTAAKARQTAVALGPQGPDDLSPAGSLT